MKILVLYQDMRSGSRKAIEEIIRSIRRCNSELSFSIYLQPVDRYVGRFSYLKNLFWSIIDYRRIVREHQDSDCIYTNMYTAVIGAAMCQPKKPVLFHLHGDQSLVSPQFSWRRLHYYCYAKCVQIMVAHLQKIAVKISSKVIFVDSASRAMFMKTYHLHLSNIPTGVVPNGVDVGRFKLASDEKKMQLKRKYKVTGKKIILYVGRIDAKKGIHHILKAVKLLRDSRIVVIIAYTISNDAYAHGYLEQLVLQSRRLNGTRVIWIPQSKNVSELYVLANCVVLPSEQEMMPLTMLEALACGIPFLGTAVGAIPSVLAQVDSRLILNSCDARSIARKIDSIIHLGKTERKKLREKSLRLAKKYSWHSSGKAIQGHIEELIQSG